jgi:hypothetical protein
MGPMDSKQEPGEALIACERWPEHPGLDGLTHEICGLLKGYDSFEKAQTLIHVLGKQASQAQSVVNRPEATAHLRRTVGIQLHRMNQQLVAQGCGLGQILLTYVLALNELFAEAVEEQKVPR